MAWFLTSLSRWWGFRQLITKLWKLKLKAKGSFKVTECAGNQAVLSAAMQVQDNLAQNCTALIISKYSYCTGHLRIALSIFE